MVWKARNSWLTRSVSPGLASSSSAAASTCRSSSSASWRKVATKLGDVMSCLGSANHFAHGAEQLLGLERLDDPACRACGASRLLLVRVGLRREHEDRRLLALRQSARALDQ